MSPKNSLEARQRRRHEPSPEGVHPLRGTANLSKDEYFRLNRNRPPTPPPIIQTVFGPYDPSGGQYAPTKPPGPNKCWNCRVFGHRYNRCPMSKTTFCYGCGMPNKRLSNCDSCRPGWLMGMLGPQYPYGEEMRPPKLPKEVVLEQLRKNNKTTSWGRCGHYGRCGCAWQPMPEGRPQKLNDKERCYASSPHHGPPRHWRKRRDGSYRPRSTRQKKRN